MRILTLFTSALFFFSLFISCSTSVEGVAVLDCAAFDKSLKALDKPQLIDVRTAQEFVDGSIYDAMNIDFYNDDFKSAMNQFDKKQPIFVFCAKGGRSSSASKVCKELGYETIYDLKGGFTAWKEYAN